MRRARSINKPLRVIHDISELPAICDNAEVGLLLRVTPEKVNRMAADGTLNGQKIAQRWIFRRADVEAYLDRLFTGEATV